MVVRFAVLQEGGLLVLQHFCADVKREQMALRDAQLFRNRVRCLLVHLAFPDIVAAECTDELRLVFSKAGFGGLEIMHRV